MSCASYRERSSGARGVEEETRRSSVSRAGVSLRESAAEGSRVVVDLSGEDAVASAEMRARAAARACSEGSLSMSRTEVSEGCQEGLG
jgi:hypothetical protein